MTKRTQLFLLTALILLNYGCVNYKRFYVKASDVYKSTSISQAPHNYDFYIHDLSGKKYQAYFGRIEDTVFISEPKEIEQVTYPEVLWNNELKLKKNDIHFFVNDTLNQDNNTLVLKQSDVKYAVVYSVTRNGAYKDAGSGTKDNTGIIALWILGILTVIILIFALIAQAMAKAAEDITNSAVNEACYIATMAYGSYEAPEVIVLRKFRDHVLMKSKLGRLFIKSYYATSPYFVRAFKNLGWMNRLIRNVLDCFVNRLKKQHGW